MHLYDYLHRYREELPKWLGGFNPGDPFPSEQFFESQVVYYPGSGSHGNPIKVFGSTSASHCFVYVDYGVEQARVERELDHPTRGVRGYRRLARLQVRERDLIPKGWTPHLHAGERSASSGSIALRPLRPFGFLEILERDPSLDGSHGAPRLAILFLGADGFAAYDALFCQRRENRRPFAVVLRDHGFGGNYDRFGGGGLLERIANRCHVLPEFLLLYDGTSSWEGYGAVRGVRGDWRGRRGGSLCCRRVLFRRAVEA